MKSISTKLKYFYQYHQKFPGLSSLFSSISIFSLYFSILGIIRLFPPLKNFSFPKVPGKIKHIVGKNMSKTDVSHWQKAPHIWPLSD